MARTTAYLDYNATAPAPPAVLAAVAEALGQGGNPSSVHGAGRQARRLVEAARAEVAALVGASPGAVVFTSGGTEANNLALAGVGAARVVVSAIEHDSVRIPAAALGIDLDILRVTADGRVAVGELDGLLTGRAGPMLVSVMAANNETGVIQPVAEIVAIARRHGALVHCDAVQAAGKIPVDFTALGVDLMSLSGHKLGAPAGIGALLLRDGLTLRPGQRGGGQEMGRRAGTENLAGIAGFGKAAELARENVAAADRLAALRAGMERRLLAAAPAARIFGADAPRLPNTTCIAMPGVASEVQVMALDLAGVAVSAGAACSSGKVQASHVLDAMGAGTAAGAAIRISSGRDTRESDIDRLVAAWTGLYRRKQAA